MRGNFATTSLSTASGIRQTWTSFAFSVADLGHDWNHLHASVTRLLL